MTEDVSTDFLGGSFCEHRSQISIRVRADTEVPLAAIGAVYPRCKDALCTPRHFTTIIYKLLWLSHFGARNHELRHSERCDSAIDRNHRRTGSIQVISMNAVNSLAVHSVCWTF